MTRQWFISDLHLALDRPATLLLFDHFCTAYPGTGDRLFILGDLFDAWIGDDDDGELASHVRRILAALSTRGVEVAIQRGNRDFLMGQRLMRECGAALLRDCHVTAVAGQPTLLMHGDLLCTDDIAYQRWRRRMRNPLVKWFLLRKPLSERRRIAAELRRRSGEAKSMKAAEIMDVNTATVVRYLQRYGVRQLIHGHTHRPQVHHHALPGGDNATRVVLPEWHTDHVAVWVDDGNSLQSHTVRGDERDATR